ncbi:MULTISPECIES: glycosyltransferase [unclassified Pseudoalteromonas]|uniref:glycosyltransferase n=1 Tax=unclassified Pseudoalteromonas TaxID=194690 RepID=UPI000231A790|nr:MULTISPECIES: glycosyltransferase [unclassified Pseudoalteromonas]MBH0003176.1 glycosyltransferase [Pseudoalteromonas sp. SWYJZ12]GAA67323.1 UDP-D-galactose:(glucosyl)LPS alpha-1,6-D-galactosyltransferase [Pseudoalteromonas sp. BSi20429]
MKILLLTNSASGGGAEKVFNSLVDGFTKHSSCEIKHLYLKESSASKFWKVSGFFKFIYLVLKFKPDVVQSHLLYPNIINSFLSIFMRYKSQLVCHSSFERLQRSRNAYIIRLAYKKASSIVCISEEMQRQARVFLSRNDIEKIYNPHDLKDYQDLSSKDVSPVPFQSFLISVGRLVESKRIKDILLALQACNKKKNLVIVGDGDTREDLIVLAKKLDIEDRVFFVGHSSNPYPYIINSEAMLLASETEGFPNCLVESLALGVPIITTNCKTGPAEILRVSYEDDVLRRPYPNCSIYPVGDIDSLVNAIDSLDDMCVDTEQLKSLVSHLDLEDVIELYYSSLQRLRNS